jgi:hypothetical protein
VAVTAYQMMPSLLGREIQRRLLLLNRPVTQQPKIKENPKGGGVAYSNTAEPKTPQQGHPFGNYLIKFAGIMLANETNW